MKRMRPLVVFSMLVSLSSIAAAYQVSGFCDWSDEPFVTYSWMGKYVPCPGDSLRDLHLSDDFPAPDSAVWRHEIRRAMHDWSRYAPVKFREVSDPGVLVNSPSVEPLDRLPIRIGAHEITKDGVPQTTTSAHSHGAATNSGDIHFNTVYGRPTDWTQAGEIHKVAIHEIGHSLGLGHSDVLDTVMFWEGSRVADSPQADDIVGIQAVYGSRDPTQIRYELRGAENVSQINPNEFVFTGYQFAKFDFGISASEFYGLDVGFAELYGGFHTSRGRDHGLTIQPASWVDDIWYGPDGYLFFYDSDPPAPDDTNWLKIGTLILPVVGIPDAFFDLTFSAEYCALQMKWDGGDRGDWLDTLNAIPAGYGFSANETFSMFLIPEPQAVVVFVLGAAVTALVQRKQAKSLPTPRGPAEK